MALDSTGLGVRVAQARQRAGLTQDDLAGELGVVRSAIAKIETGARRVTALELSRIAMAVGERMEWLVEEPTPSIVAYRNTTDPGEPSPSIDRAIDRVVRDVEFTAEHDQGLQAVLRSVPAESEPANTGETEALAERARTLLGVGRDEPLYNLSERLVAAGILTFVMDLGSEAADAGCVLLREGAIAVVNGSLRDGRRRLALAHEFGHILIADQYTVDWRLDSGTSTSTDARERALDRFARALLLPRTSLALRWEQWTGSRTDTAAVRVAAVQAASHFRVDMSTLARRLLDLGLIDGAAAACVRMAQTLRADIVEHNLVVAPELLVGELPRPYEVAVLRLFTSEVVSEARAIDLLFDTWSSADLPELPMHQESEIWQFVS